MQDDRTQVNAIVPTLNRIDAHNALIGAGTELSPVNPVDRIAEGIWRVPADLPEQGRRYDAQHLGGVAVELRSRLPIGRQSRVVGATWLD